MQAIHPSHSSPASIGTAQPGYRVQLYGLVRVTVNVPAATSPMEAIVQAEATPGLSQWFQHGEYAHELMAAHVIEHGKVDIRQRQTYVPTFGEFVGWKADAQRDLEYSARIHRHHDACLFMSELLESFESLSAIGEKHGASTLASLLYLVDAIQNDGCIDVPAFDPSILPLICQLPSASSWIRYMRLVA
ncbi:hypothetical protein DM48_7850 [Burkholderia gladioli]|uniref:Uncharacterized protein n=1 Tax=Burkholderia gladioli TaxID=28095 RepID=A0AAW3FAN6_BURGA|nr:hypothetical protein [Burkholderia gladioli]KGC20319.1 hypothetical protein DM48_7850 [Burkholderia gladioli]